MTTEPDAQLCFIDCGKPAPECMCRRLAARQQAERRDAWELVDPKSGDVVDVCYGDDIKFKAGGLISGKRYEVRRRSATTSGGGNE